MSETTTTINPAVYHQILQGIQQGSYEMEIAVTTTPDGTQTQTIIIRPVAPVVVPMETGQRVVEAPKPKPHYYCPDCPDYRQPVPGQCTPTRVGLPRRCEKHSHCPDCKNRLQTHERLRCGPCNSWAQHGIW